MASQPPLPFSANPDRSTGGESSIDGDNPPPPCLTHPLLGASVLFQRSASLETTEKNSPSGWKTAAPSVDQKPHPRPLVRQLPDGRSRANGRGFFDLL